ncbi:hypothetical protein [Thermococcus sp. LS2]|uniref:hypothetical protein n=1 Tax=Thermococcus sp. LS2 TaxID=1638260 RepID=UPI00143C8FF8|nr:hypothetical protein [Thermococcus sp. LS2]
MEIFKERRIYYERAWERSLAHQINPLPEFEKIWNDVLINLALKPELEGISYRKF